MPQNIKEDQKYESHKELIVDLWSEEFFEKETVYFKKLFNGYTKLLSESIINHSETKKLFNGYAKLLSESIIDHSGTKKLFIGDHDYVEIYGLHSSGKYYKFRWDLTSENINWLMPQDCEDVSLVYFHNITLDSLRKV